MAEELLRTESLDCGAVAGASLTVTAGECVALHGPSGAGKTRLLRAVADLDPHGGEAYLRGRPCSDHAPHEWRRHVVLVPSEPHWWAERVGDHFPAVDDEALAALGFDRTVTGWTVTRLSSGERQRLGLLRALALEPPVLLLDEPTANLDDESTARVEALLAAHRRRGSAQLWVSHDAAQRRRVARRAFAVDGGRLEAD